MRIVVFLGPSLPLTEAQDILDAIYLPPVEQADLTSAITTYHPDVIGIVDGKFLQSLSVWHKEILFALEQGVRVYGASSMGALRAAETSEFGMIGVGEVFRLYASGELEDDDEVALVHGSAETGYLKLSEPLVNVRATLNLARDRGLLSTAQWKHITAIAKSIYFPELNFRHLFARAASDGLPAEVLRDLGDFVSNHYQDVKKQDAILLLQTIRDLPDPLPPLRPNFELAPSVFFHTLYNRDRKVPHEGTNVRLAAIANYTALHYPNFSELNFAAMNRVLVRILAELLKVDVPIEATDREIRRFRYRHALLTDKAFSAWLEHNDLSNAEFTAWMHETALCRELHSWLRMRHAVDGTTKFLLDELRWTNSYEEWANAAAIQEQIIQTQHHFATEGQDPTNTIEDLVEDHLQYGGGQMDVHFTVWATEAGFHKVEDLRLELLRSKLTRLFLERLAAQLEGLDDSDAPL